MNYFEIQFSYLISYLILLFTMEEYADQVIPYLLPT